MSKDEINTINWQEDAWFAGELRDKLTDEFKAWWLEWYGLPDVWKLENDRFEYWTRCGFALMGWLAGRKQILESAGGE